MTDSENDGPDFRGDPADDGPRAIQSEILLTLVTGRAHILSVMSNARLSRLSKMVGCLLWAITDTWGPGEERRVTMPQIAEAITYTEMRNGTETEVHPDPRRVGEAVRELEAEGYLRINSPQWGARGVGRGAATGIRIWRRTVADPHTHGDKAFRSWTQAILDENPEVVAQVSRKVGRVATPSTRPKKVGPVATPSDHKVQRVATPSIHKVGPVATPSDQEGVASRPLQGVDQDLSRPRQEPDLGEADFSPPPLPTRSARGDAPLQSSDSRPVFDSGASVTDKNGQNPPDTSDWSQIGTPTDAVNFIHDNLAGVGQDLFTRDRRLEAIGCLKRYNEARPLSANRAVYLLSVWAAQTDCAHADKIVQYIERYIRESSLDASLYGTEDYTPLQVMKLGIARGHALVDELAKKRAGREARKQQSSGEDFPW